jgi:hypothetical protein
MELHQCCNCGHNGWTIYELKEGLCPSCQESDEPDICLCGNTDELISDDDTICQNCQLPYN